MRYDPDIIMKHRHPAPGAETDNIPPAAAMPSPMTAAKAAALFGLAAAPWSFFLCPPCYVLPLLAPDDF